MRINCDFKLNDRSLASHNVRLRGKAARASLSLARRPDGKGGATSSLLVCTAKNRAGTKYTVDGGNLKCIFSRMVDKGQATLSFNSPPHDLLLSECDPIALRSFLKVALRLAKGQDVRALGVPSVLAPATATQLARPVTKMEVSKKADYPKSKGFPKDLRTLRILGIGLRRFDPRIAYLKHLSTLSLQGNCLKEIPPALGQMKTLQELRLDNNELESLPLHLFKGGLGHTLQFLDVSHNHISQLPNEVCLLRALVVLKIQCNRLSRLPVYLSRNLKLTVLDVSRNEISTLAGVTSGYFARRMESLEISHNKFENVFISGRPILYDSTSKLPSLTELCLRSVHRWRADTSAVLLPEVVPKILLDQLEDYLVCEECNQGLFRERAVVLKKCTVDEISSNVTTTAREIYKEFVICHQCGARSQHKSYF